MQVGDMTDLVVVVSLLMFWFRLWLLIVVFWMDVETWVKALTREGEEGSGRYSSLSFLQCGVPT